MTIAATQDLGEHLSDASTLSFPYSGRILDASHIQVIVNKVIQPTGYSVTGVGSAGGNVVFATAPAPAGLVIRFLRNTPINQLSDYEQNETFPALRVETDFDKHTTIELMLAEQLARALLFNKGSLYDGIQIDDPIPHLLLRWKADLTGIEGVAPESVPISGTADTLRIGDSGIMDASVEAQSIASIQKQDSTDENAYSLAVHLTVNDFTPTATRLKAAILGTVHTYAEGDIDQDPYVGAVGVYGQGRITGINQLGGAWGMVAETMTHDTNQDGFLVGIEVDVNNKGSIVTTIADPKSKYGILLTSHSALGGLKATAGIVFHTDPAPSGWEFGLVLTSVHSRFIQMFTPLTANAVAIDIQNHANWAASAIILPNNSALAGYNAAGSVVHQMIAITPVDEIAVGKGSGGGCVLFTGTDEFLRTTAEGIYLTGTGQMHICYPDATTTPPNPTENRVHTYKKANKFIIQYDDGGTVRYKYLDLTGTGVAWVHTTSAP